MWLAAAVWLTVVLLLLMALRLSRLTALMTLGAAGLLAVGLIGFALSGDRARS